MGSWIGFPEIGLRLGDPDSKLPITETPHQPASQQLFGNEGTGPGEELPM
jgi:hypothetical protein